MKRLKIFILIFCVTLSIPLVYLVLVTYQSLEQEEVAKLRYFAEALFDEIENELSSIVLKEENRAIDEYNYKFIPSGFVPGSTKAVPSPLSKLPEEDYMLGYLQNNPDGSFQTPLIENEESVTDDKVVVISQLKDVNRIFNLKRLTGADVVKESQAKAPQKQEGKRATGFADKYLDLSKDQKPKAYLGSKEKRVEQITAAQAQKITRQDGDENLENKMKGRKPQSVRSFYRSARDQASEDSLNEAFEDKEKSNYEDKREQVSEPLSVTKKYQVEVAPLQSIFIDKDQVFIFRRIMINKQIYRQGFIIKIGSFLTHLANSFFLKQPLALYTNLSLKIEAEDVATEIVRTGAVTKKVNFLLNRTFPSPFSFLSATLTCNQIPRSESRRTLQIIIAVLALVVLMGLFSIYHSARTVVDLSERRSKFVSSVTHELKTPLTNIRMYIEMLEQGIARDQEREQDYFQILGSESARLSRLINNVLELSKLEKKQRHIHLKKGTFEDVIQEIESVMQEKLRQEGFTFSVDIEDIHPFTYDKEVMILILINLIENSMKFGKDSPTREISLKIRQEKDGVNINLVDTGPGIPRHALKKIFDDFYRVEGSLTRATAGTGIGLSLVKKFVTLLGGTVRAENNTGPGCTITISLP